MSATTLEEPITNTKLPIEELEAVTIRFAGDSGDGMQVTGGQFTSTSAIIGNDISTLPDFPAEIRAPAGSLPGVSGYQLNFSSRDIRTPGDEPLVLVAMNPAALKVNIKDLEPGGILVLNADEFNDGNLKKAGYAANPLNDGSLSGYRVFQIPITSLTLKALENSSLPFKQQERCKNFYALGLMYWLYDRPMEPTLKWIDDKFGAKPEVAEANIMALRAGYNYADTMGSNRASTATSPATRPRQSGSSPLRNWPGARSFTAVIRSRRPPTSCTSFQSTRISASKLSRPKTRSPPSARQSARPLPAISG